MFTRNTMFGQSRLAVEENNEEHIEVEQAGIHKGAVVHIANSGAENPSKEKARKKALAKMHARRRASNATGIGLRQLDAAKAGDKRRSSVEQRADNDEDDEADLASMAGARRSACYA